MSPVFETLLLTIALAGLETIRTVPQLTRVWRTKDVRGLSASAMAIRTVSGVGWLAYAIDLGEPAAIASSVVFQVIMLATAFAMARAGGLPGRSWVSAIPMVLAIGVAIGIGAATGTNGAPLILLMNTSLLVWGIPQLVVALRSSRLSGYSPVALAVSLVDALVWGAYGTLIGDSGYLLYCGVCVALVTPVLIRYVKVEVGREEATISSPSFGVPAQSQAA